MKHNIETGKRMGPGRCALVAALLLTEGLVLAKYQTEFDKSRKEILRMIDKNSDKDSGEGKKSRARWEYDQKAVDFCFQTAYAGLAAGTGLALGKTIKGMLDKKKIQK